MQPYYEKQAYGEGYQAGYSEGYQAGQLEEKRIAYAKNQDAVRAGMLESIKQHYEALADKARQHGFEQGKKAGYSEGYQAGKADGIQEGEAKGRRERIEKILLPGEDIAYAAARLQGIEAGRSQLAGHLMPILAQVQEGSPLAAAIAGRIADAMQDFINTTI